MLWTRSCGFMEINNVSVGLLWSHGRRHERRLMCVVKGYEGDLDPETFLISLINLTVANIFTYFNWK